MHELAAGQDTQKSWPVGITGFGVGVTDQPREALAGTEALAGIAAAPARTTAAATPAISARRRVLMSASSCQLRAASGGHWWSCATGTGRSGDRSLPGSFRAGLVGVEPGRVHEAFAGDAEPVAGRDDRSPGRAAEQAQYQVVGGEQQAA